MINYTPADPESELGRGAFAKVYSGTYDGGPVAVKKVRLENIREVDKELEALINLNNHPNVVELRVHEDRGTHRLYALELCATSLDKVFDRTYRDPLILSETRMIYQLASGLRYIHEQNFLHLDIRPSNILISVNGEQMKWADFGLSERADENGGKEVDSTTGEFAYLAAEVASQLENGTITVTTRSDIFAAGCVFSKIFHPDRSHPFGVEEDNAPNNIEDGNPINELEKDHFAYDVIRRMISKDATGRSGTLTEILESCTQAELAYLCSTEELNENDLNQLRELLHQSDFTSIPLLFSKIRSNALVHIIELFLHQYQRNDPNIIKGFSTLCTNYNNVRLLDIANLFVNRGFRLVSNEDNDNDQSTLQKLCENYKQENLGKIIELLINQGAKLNHPGPNGRTALHSLCENYPHDNLHEIVQLMTSTNIDHRADVNIQQLDNGYTPLHCLCQYYRHDNLAQVIRSLLDDGGADTRIRDTTANQSALEILQNRQQANDSTDLTAAINLLMLFRRDEFAMEVDP